MKKYRVLIVALFIFVGGSCSTYLLKTAYNWADTYIYGKVTDYFTLTSAQKTQVKQKIKQLIYWHRKQVLPQYQKTLAIFKGKVENKLQFEDIAWLEKEVEKAIMQVVRYVFPHVVDFLSQIDHSQLESYQKETQNNFEKLQKQLKDPWSKRQKKLFDSLMSRLENIYGSFNDGQRTAIFAYFNRIPDSLKEQMEHNAFRNQQFYEFMKQNPTKEQISAKLNPWFMQWQNNLQPAYRNKIITAAKLRLEMFYQVDRLLTEKQRQHGVNKIQEYIDIIVDLHNQ